MTDLNSIFEPTTPLTSNPPAVDKPKKKSGKKAASANGGPKRRGPRRVHAPSANPPTADEPAPKAGKKRGRKPRQPGSSARPPKADKGVKLDLTTMMGALVGLKAQDAALVGKITQALGTVNKKSRARVLEAVGRIFA